MAERHRIVWELWSRGYGGRHREEPMYIETFYDKGNAQRRLRSLQRNHPGVRYELRSRSLHTRRRGFVPFERRR